MDWERDQEGEKEDGERQNISTMERASRSSDWREETTEKQLSRNEQSLQTELGAGWEERRGAEKEEEKLQQREEVGNKEVSMETIQPEVT